MPPFVFHFLPLSGVRVHLQHLRDSEADCFPFDFFPVCELLSDG